MQWSPFVLILMGQCSLCVCFLYEYHFVQQKKSWDEAQKHCRELYTDLATVFNTTDMERLRDLAGKQGDAWIGLRKQNVTKRRWHWSLPGMEFNDSETQWSSGEPNDFGGAENCVVVLHHKWVDIPCTRTYIFICYDAKNNKKFHLIDQPKTWREAQSYCRENHTDLVSGLTQLNNEAFKKEIETRPQVGVWIGLFRDTWRWSDESNFRHWDPKLFEDEDEKKCATVSDGNWSSAECDKTKPFFCYDVTGDQNNGVPSEFSNDGQVAEEVTDEVILINKNMTWEKALTYCRENHRDLVSITNAKEQRWVQKRAKRATSTHVWVGLRYSCTLDLWFWVTDEAVRYKNWNRNQEMDDCDMSGAMEREGQHKWFKQNADMKFNFICSK